MNVGRTVRKQQIRSEITEGKVIDNVDTSKDLSVLQELTYNQLRFVKAYLKNGGSVTSAWFKTHKCKNRQYASVAGNRFMRKHPELKKALYEYCGLGDGEIIKVLKDAFKAKRQTLDKEGNEHYSKDHYARLKAAQLAKEFSEMPEESQAKGNQLNVVIVSDRKNQIFEVGEEVS